MKTFRIIWKRTNGKRGTLFPGPLTHDEACRCLSALTRYPWRSEELEEIR